MKNKIIGLSLTVIALIGASFTFTHSVYYASDEDRGILAPLTVQVTQAQTVQTSGTTSSSGATTPVPALLPPSPAQVAPFPATLSIPSLGIDAHVQEVGVKPNGNMGTPNNFTDVAWYRDGTVPGTVGSAVMDGHVDNGLALAGVFKHLQDIQVGADVYVTRNDGKKLHFVVTAVTLYPFDSAPPATVFTAVDGSYLNLITCTGDWVAAQKTYNQRLVVSTKLAA